MRQIQSFAEFSDMLAVVGKIDMMGPLLRFLMQEIVGQTKMNFQKQQDPDGIPWKPLKRPRANSKGADKILMDTGLLRTSVTAKGSTQNVFRETHDSIEFGTNVHYAPFHQYGTKTIPSRPFLGIGNHLADKLEQMAADWVTDQIQESLERG